MTTTKARLADLLRGDLDVDGLLDADETTVEGDRAAVETVLGSLDTFSGVFGIVEP